MLNLWMHWFITMFLNKSMLMLLLLLMLMLWHLCLRESPVIAAVEQHRLSRHGIAVNLFRVMSAVNKGGNDVVGCC